MRYYLIAGEASGDLHGSNLVKGIKEVDPNAQMRCWGGDLMKEAGAELVKEIQDHVKRTTAPYKYPRVVEFVDELPKTISGKIKRYEIRKK